jgi:hypothetical protein
MTKLPKPRLAPWIRVRFRATSILVPRGFATPLPEESHSSPAAPTPTFHRGFPPADFTTTEHSLPQKGFLASPKNGEKLKQKQIKTILKRQGWLKVSTNNNNNF